MNQKLLDEVVSNFQFQENLLAAENYGNGHINDTYLLQFEGEKMILQRMNKAIFNRPVELMENIVNVTSYLQNIIEKNGGDPKRETLNVILTKSGEPCYCDSNGEYWRAYRFIEGAICYEQVEHEEDFYQSGLAFGNFQRLLAEFPAETLHETIAGFHDTRARFQVFKQAVAEDICGRAAEVQDEIAFVMEHEHLASVFGELMDKGELPVRVTHNDTKLNNIMMDAKTGRGLCVIDLDTVLL